MRILMTLIFAFGMASPSFAGVLNERDQRNQWFQNCEEEIAKPFCGTLKLNLAVEVVTWQWQKQSTLDKRTAESSADRVPTTSYLNPHNHGEVLSLTEEAK